LPRAEPVQAGKLKAAAAALYRKRPDAAELAKWGLRPEDFAEDWTVELWPDNLIAANVFITMGTQWRVGPGGAYGLDYGTLPAVMDMLGVQAADRAEVLDAIRTMEDAALEEMRKS
jgi:hypothetical protein